MLVRSGLLGVASGLLLVVAASSAEMPVKATPVQYVKICSAYGDGFYAIPGADTCVKLGGYLRVQAEYNAGAGGIPIGSGTTPESTQSRFARDVTNDVNFRTRAALSWDVRQPTQYGVLRTYVRLGIQQTTPSDPEAGAVFWDRAFMQFAGFTIGKTQSFFDIAGGLADIHYHNTRLTGDTVASGMTVWAYTAIFGNGVSGTLALENSGSNRYPVVDVTVPGFFAANSVVNGDTAFNAQPPGGSNGFRIPDVVGALRVDQDWGYVGVSAAIHEAGGAYYLTPNLVNNGHPPDRLGWAASIGGRLYLAGGDLLGVNACYSQGAVGYCSIMNNGMQLYNASTSVGVGWATDGVFGIGSPIELTRAWGAVAYYQHIWTSQWRTSLYGGYVAIDYNAAATDLINGSLSAAGRAACASGLPAPPALIGSFTQVTPGAGSSCNPDFSFWEIGTRTQWNPVPQLDVGLDVAYQRLNTAFKGAGSYASNAPRPLVPLFDDQGVWSAYFRWQRNFYP